MILQVILAVAGLIIAFLLLYFLVIKKDDKKTTNPVTIAPKTKRILRLEERFDKDVRRHMLRFPRAFHDAPPPVVVSTSYYGYDQLIGLNLSQPIVTINPSTNQPVIPNNPATGQPFPANVINSVMLVQESGPSYPNNLNSGDIIYIGVSNTTNPPADTDVPYIQQFTVMSYDNSLVIDGTNNTLQINNATVNTPAITIPPGNYSMTDLITNINILLQTASIDIVFTQDSSSNQIVVTSTDISVQTVTVGIGTINGIFGLVAGPYASPYIPVPPALMPQTFVLYLGSPDNKNLPANWNSPIPATLPNIVVIAKEKVLPDLSINPPSEDVPSNQGFQYKSKAMIQQYTEGNDSAGQESQAFSEMVGYDATVDQLVNALDDWYPMFNSPDGLTRADVVQALYNAGLLSLNIALTTSGYGFWIGPLNSAANAIASATGVLPPEPSAPEPPDMDQIKKLLTDQALINNIQNIHDQLSYIFTNLQTTFWPEYYKQKYERGSLCPDNSGCAPNTGPDGITPVPGCDPVLFQKTQFDCMQRPVGLDPTVLYDPSLTLTNNRSMTLTKRQDLQNFLTNNNGALWTLLKSTNGPLTKMTTYFNNQNAGIGYFIELGGPYLMTLTMMICYYQELASLDTQNVGTNYNNPWISTSIGNIFKILDITSGQFLPQTSIQNQVSGCLLGDLQAQATLYQTFITNAAKLYFQRVSFSYDDLDCSWMSWFFAGLTRCNPRSAQCIPKYTCRVSDNMNGMIDETWYEAMQLKYPNSKGIYKSSGDPMVYVGTSTGTNPVRPGRTNDCQNRTAPPLDPTYGPRIEIITRIYFYTFFHEYLSFPCNQLIILRQMAGIVNNIQANDIWNNLMYDDLVNRCGYSPSLVQLYLSQPTPMFVTGTNPTGLIPAGSPGYFDPAGGYPFGLQRPSYKQAIQNWINKFGYTGTVSSVPPNPSALPITGPLPTDDDYNFGSFCTPMMSVTTNDTPVDLRMFNIPGDSGDIQGHPWTQGQCTNPNNIGITSCLKSLVNPGSATQTPVNGSQTVNGSRSTFCVDSNGKTAPVVPYSNATPPQGTFTITGGFQNIVIPAGVLSVDFEIWGGGGGSCSNNSPVAYGGGGGYVVGNINVLNEGDVLQVVVGFGAGSGNAGGNAGASTYFTNAGGNGGGATGIFLASETGVDSNNNPIYTPITEIATAGGGGGGGVDNSGGNVWHGGPGGLPGYIVVNSAMQASPSCGGAGGIYAGGIGAGTPPAPPGTVSNTGNPGSRFQGANAINNGYNFGGAGGGGGSFGGGSGGNNNDGSRWGGTGGGGGSNNFNLSFCSSSTAMYNGNFQYAGQGPTGISPNYVTNVGVGSTAPTPAGQYGSPNGYPGYAYLKFNYA